MFSIPHAVYTVYTNHYSKSMVRALEWTFKNAGITEVTSKETGVTYHLRVSHGILHTVAVMELIPEIIKLYEAHVPDAIEGLKQLISDRLEMPFDDCLGYLKIAGLFHDAAREGDGADYWDEQSADLCKQYLTSYCELPEEKATLIANTIRYKDDCEKFIEAIPASYRKGDNGQTWGLLREFVNMADTVEVLRARLEFKPKYLPIMKHLDPARQEPIISFVSQYRERMGDEGRLNWPCARVISCPYPEYNKPRKFEYNNEAIAKRYEEIMRVYAPHEESSLLIARVKRDITRSIRSIFLRSGVTAVYGLFHPKEERDTHHIMGIIDAIDDTMLKPKDALDQMIQAFSMAETSSKRLMTVLKNCQKLCEITLESLNDSPASQAANPPRT